MGDTWPQARAFVSFSRTGVHRSPEIHDDGFFGPTRFAGLHSQYACHQAVHMALAARNHVARH
jgi:hypothetical protein